MAKARTWLGGDGLSGRDDEGRRCGFAQRSLRLSNLKTCRARQAVLGATSPACSTSVSANGHVDPNAGGEPFASVREASATFAWRT